MNERVWCFQPKVLLLVAWLGCSGAALAQTGAAPAAAKAPVFEAVTIKPNNSAMQGGAWGASATGYRGKNVPLVRVILQAYLGVPSVPVDRVKNAPAWVMNDPYDITGKADEGTIEAMKGMKQAQQIALEAPMLRAMLEERCKLMLHTEPGEVQGYALVVGKRGNKMKESQPDEPLPQRIIRFEGEWGLVPPSQPGPEGMQTAGYRKITMAELVAFIGMGANPVVDQTGLTGKYDFDLQRTVTITQPEPGAPLPPLPDVAHLWDWEAIGLEMKPIKVPVKILVIDHIERPAEN